MNLSESGFFKFLGPKKYECCQHFPIILPYMQSRNHCLLQLFSSLLNPFYTARNYSYIWAYKLFMCVPMHMEYIHTH